jgi:hypothetical protein
VKIKINLSYRPNNYEIFAKRHLICNRRCSSYQLYKLATWHTVIQFVTQGGPDDASSHGNKEPLKMVRFIIVATNKPVIRPILRQFNPCEFSGSHGDEYKDVCPWDRPDEGGSKHL